MAAPAGGGVLEAAPRYRATTLPVGFGGDQPRVGGVTLAPGDRILCFTDV
ncbi:hypothetical protein [Streptomyces roseicoloratus]